MTTTAGTGVEVLRDALEAHGSRVTRSGAGFTAQCPAHDDRNASLSFGPGTKQPVVAYCHAGCSEESILAAVHLPPDALCAPRGEDRPADEWTPAGPAVAVYDYVDEDGNLLFQVTRTADKQFRQRRPDPSKKTGWTWDVKGVRRVLYRLPKVNAAAAAGHTVYVVEGEKDVHALETLGVTATCSPMGASNAGRADWTALTGAKVVIVADRDEAGKRYALDVRRILGGLDTTVEVRLAAVGKDAHDHVAAGHGLDDFVPAALPDDEDNPTGAGWSNYSKQGLGTFHGGRRPTADEPARPLPNYDPTLYDRRPVLGAIRDHAHSRCVSADALTLSVLALVSGSIPGGIIIDSGVRRPTTPGVYVATCAESGVGKTAAAGVAQDLLDVPVTYALSTGEGMLECFYGAVDVYNQKGDKTGTRRAIVRHNALFSADEGQTLFAEMAREGSKFGSILRSFWSGIGIGTANASADRNRSLPRGSYNGAVLIGLQPTLVGDLITDTALGTAQRFLWAAAHDVHLNPAAPGWDGPLFLPPDIPRDTDGEPVLRGEKFTVDPAITAELRAAEVAKMTLAVPVDEHDSQRAVQLLKLSATLAWMDTRLHITVEDWLLAEAILLESNQVRDALIESAEQQARDRLVKAGHQRAAVRAAENGRDRAIAEVKTRLVELLGRTGDVIPAGRLRAGVNPRGGKRGLVPDALELLIGDGTVQETTTAAGNLAYTLSQGVEVDRV